MKPGDLCKCVGGNGVIWFVLLCVCMYVSDSLCEREREHHVDELILNERINFSYKISRSRL